MSPSRPPVSCYRCVQCGSGLAATAGDLFACGVCGAEYPSLGGVDVLALDHHQLLQSYVNGLAVRRQEISDNQAKLAGVTRDGLSREALAAAQGGFAGQLANVEAVERVMAPVKAYLAARPAPRNPFGGFQLGNRGWPSFTMLGYFQRDWGEADETRFVTDLFAGAVDRYGPSRDSVAVLGSGACRLVHDMAATFTAAFGLDLAVDCLLLARALLDGAEIDLHFNLPLPQIPVVQRTVRLTGPVQRREGARLVAGDAARLPFASGSISCVMTPYLLDIVPNPRAVVAEIRRVLTAEGLWINFSNLGEQLSPRAVRAFDQLDNLDLPGFLRRSGFRLLEQAMHRFRVSSLADVSGWATTQIEAPVYVVAAKDHAPDEAPCDVFEEHFSRRVDAVWTLVPSLAAYVALLQEKVFTGRAVEERTRIAALTPDGGRVISPQGAAMAEWLLHHIDGVRTIGAIGELLRAQFGNVVASDDLVRLFRNLHASELIELRPA